MLQAPVVKKSAKQARIHKVLLGLVDFYIRFGRPVGSDTLKEAGFEDLSSATIRNYFASLEEEGYLTQVHTSGGRLPTALALRLYAAECLKNYKPKLQEKSLFPEVKNFESKEIALLMQSSSELLSQKIHCPVFISAPRFDQDFVTHIKLVPLEGNRCLCVLITDFGVIKTETLYLPSKRSHFSIKRIESYFYWRLTNMLPPEPLEEEEEELAKTLYNEIMVRYIVGYSNFLDEEIHRTGFSRLLNYPEFQDPALLANSLNLFENGQSMRLLLKEATAQNRLRFWIGDDLNSYAQANPNCTVLAIPYYINQHSIGAIGMLGPMRLPYQELFETLHQFSASVSETLTRMVYKFKISYREPAKETSWIQQKHDNNLLLEDKSLPHRRRGE